MEFNSYNELKKKKIGVLQLLNFHFNEIGKTIKRKITTRQIRNPGKLISKYKLPPSVYREWFSAVCDHCTNFGVNIEIKRNQKRILTETNLKFYHLGPLQFHFTEAAGVMQNCF